MTRLGYPRIERLHWQSRENRKILVFLCTSKFFATQKICERGEKQSFSPQRAKISFRNFFEREEFVSQIPIQVCYSNFVTKCIMSIYKIYFIISIYLNLIKRMTKMMKADDIKPSSHWFRRMIHVSGACALVYYLYPDNVLWIHILKIVVVLTILISTVVVEVLRLTCKLDRGFLFPFRSYEAGRIGAYIWFGISISALLLFFPQQIAGPCILIVCIADPLIGEIRDKNHVLSVLTGITVCFCIFFIFNYSMYIALFTALLAVGAERIKTKKVDDDFLMPIIPAIVIYILTLLTIIILPEILIIPFPM